MRSYFFHTTIIYLTYAHAMQEQPPLHKAVIGRNEFQVRRLLLDRYPVNSPNGTGQTALHLAIRFGHERIAQILLEHGANIFLKNLNGETPLDLALRFGTEDWNYRMLQLLIDHSRLPILPPVAHEIARAFKQACMARQVKKETYFWTA